MVAFVQWEWGVGVSALVWAVAVWRDDCFARSPLRSLCSCSNLDLHTTVVFVFGTFMIQLRTEARDYWRLPSQVPEPWPLTPEPCVLFVACCLYCSICLFGYCSAYVCAVSSVLRHFVAVCGRVRIRITSSLVVVKYVNGKLFYNSRV